MCSKLVRYTYVPAAAMARMPASAAGVGHRYHRPGDPSHTLLKHVDQLHGHRAYIEYGVDGRRTQFRVKASKDAPVSIYSGSSSNGTITWAACKSANGQPGPDAMSVLSRMCDLAAERGNLPAQATGAT